MPDVKTQQHFHVPQALSLLIAHNRRAQALKFLDRLIGSDYGFFSRDSQIVNDRQAALRFKIDLLLEWNRHSEALAWLCLETEINPDNVYAQALKQRLKRGLHIDDLHRSPFQPRYKKIYIGPPDLEARVEAIKLYMKDRPQEQIDYYSALTDKDLYSYADLELVVNEAAREALQTRVPVARKHLDDAFSVIPASITTKIIADMSKE